MTFRSLITQSLMAGSLTVAGILGWSGTASALSFTGNFNSIGIPAIAQNSANFSTADSAAVDSSDFEAALGIDLDGTDAVERTGVQSLLQNLVAGDRIRFNWNFSSSQVLLDENDPNDGPINILVNDMTNDFAFFSITQIINGSPTAQLFKLADLRGSLASNPFDFVVGSTGDYILGFGVLDVGDELGDSFLAVNNLSITPASTPIPTPAMLPGLVGMGIATFRKRRQAQAAIEE